MRDTTDVAWDILSLVATCKHLHSMHKVVIVVDRHLEASTVNVEESLDSHLLKALSKYNEWQHAGYARQQTKGYWPALSSSIWSDCSSDSSSARCSPRLWKIFGELPDTERQREFITFVLHHHFGLKPSVKVPARLVAAFQKRCSVSVQLPNCVFVNDLNTNNWQLVVNTLASATQLRNKEPFQSYCHDLIWYSWLTGFKDNQFRHGTKRQWDAVFPVVSVYLP